MCVIALADDGKRIEASAIEDMFTANSHGAGIAWRDEVDGKKVVKFEKGLDLEGIQDLCATVPLPYCAHFRIATCGPRDGICAPLNHPFPIEVTVPLMSAGHIAGDVLFHNGHWGNWESNVKDLAIRGAYKIPPGLWSDSRAMAYMAAHLGTGILSFIDQKAVVFGVDEIYVVSGTGWSSVNGILVSNTGWRRTYTKPTSARAVNDKEDHTSKEKSTTIHLLSDGGGTLSPQPSKPTEKDSLNTGPESMPTGTNQEAPIGPHKGTGGSSADDPFDLSGLVITDEVMTSLEYLHIRKNPEGVRLLSKTKIRHYRNLHQKWRRTQAKLALAESRRGQSSQELTH